ncbi:hypothetical protein [Thalassotalea mangrovi]|uniref:Uncharacterized protein n=1 Tax=Thalassotalea mangrovi TaxID=2572245 RepID=A0A4U1B2A8_9GAMM|nr:hypothetical protein [Thalassotalea mangrovi]TKB43773.1 hypothetical protein E8M12_14215 [Thalassotalea mangrovi]
MINAAKNINKASAEIHNNTALAPATRSQPPATNVVPFPIGQFNKGLKRSLLHTWKEVYQQRLIRHSKKKWVMVINANKAQLQALSILPNTDHLLAVNPKKDLPFATLLLTLKSGNCSTLIMANCQFSAQQMQLLKIEADKNSCCCILISKEKQSVKSVH